MKKAKVFRLVILGIFTALTIILTFTPLGYIPIGVLIITTIHIPIIIAAILMGPVDGMIVGGIAGLMCLFRAIAMPVAPTDVLFINPLVSVVPRALIGLVAAVVYSGMQKLFRDPSKIPTRATSITVAAIAGTLTNTVGVLTVLGLIYPDAVGVSNAGEIFSKLIAATLISNGIFEIIAAVIITVPVIIALSKVMARRKAQ